MFDKKLFVLVITILLVAGCASVGRNPQMPFESRVDNSILENIWSGVKDLASISKETPRPLISYSYQYLKMPGSRNLRAAAFTVDTTLILVFRDGMDLCLNTDNGKCGVDFYSVMEHEFLHAALLEKGVSPDLQHSVMAEKYYSSGTDKILKKYFAKSPHIKFAH